MAKVRQLVGVPFMVLTAMMLVGCGDRFSDVVEPHKPPLSAEAAKEKAQKEQREKINSLQEQAKKRGKK